MSTETYGEGELAAIKGLQRLAYDCAEQVAAGLHAGVTEIEAAERLGASLRAAGADGFFHMPFAWFGERAGFVGFPPGGASWRRPLASVAFAREFFPTERRLQPGMAGILDVAPIRGGLCADIGYSFSLGEHAGLRAALRDLGKVRSLVLALVRQERSMREIYQVVDAALADMGYESAHALYPSGVIGHKIGRIPLAGLPARMLAGFDLRTYLYFARQLVTALPGVGRVPLWNGGRLADAPPDRGLWALEPHVRRGELGAKWEEILVITESDAYWLDDDLPHVHAAAAPAPAAPAPAAPAPAAPAPASA